MWPQIGCGESTEMDASAAECTVGRWIELVDEADEHSKKKSSHQEIRTRRGQQAVALWQCQKGQEKSSRKNRRSKLTKKRNLIESERTPFSV